MLIRQESDRSGDSFVVVMWVNDHDGYTVGVASKMRPESLSKRVGGGCQEGPVQAVDRGRGRRDRGVLRQSAGRLRHHQRIDLAGIWASCIKNGGF
jgi:hypothetical protein